MLPSERDWFRWLGWAAFGASAANFASIAVAHTILGGGGILLLLRPRSARMPPIAWPLLALIFWTLVATAASDDPAAALPQLKKFFVFTMLPVVFTAARTVDRCRRFAETWFVVALGASAMSIAQFAVSSQEVSTQDGDFYSMYVGDRITGFYSHWMTFSQSTALAFVTLASYLLFARRRPGRWVWVAVTTAIGMALLLSFTRSVWLALIAASLYLLAAAKPRALLAVPVLLAVVYAAAPDSVRQRVHSIRPGANENRLVMWRTGLNMIATHPLLGVGPELAGQRFAEFQPADVEELPPGFYGHLHNVYIHFAAERGLPAALIVLWLFGRIVWDMRLGLRGLPDGRDDRRFLLHAGVAGTLAVALVSCFDVSLGDSEILGAYLALAAIAYRGVSSNEK